MNPEMRGDLFWLLAFMDKFNGIHLIRQPVSVYQVAVDACLSAGRGIWRDMFMAIFPPSVTACGWDISQLEVFTFLLAVRWWQQQFHRRNVTIWCDNAATVAVMQSGRGVDPCKI